MLTEIAGVGASLIRLPQDDRALTWKRNAEARTNVLIRRTTIPLPETATIRGKVGAQITADSADFQAILIARQRNRIAQPPAHSQAVIVGDGSASLLEVRGRVTALRHMEARIEAGLLWS
jgi:hypothetical protein